MAKEDPTNFWPIDLAARALMPLALRLRVQANAVSIGGFLIGATAALTLGVAPRLQWTLVSLVLSVIWLLADSLDGMIARASGTASAFGRELDGFCDHGVFLLLYVALAWPTREGVAWWLVVVAASAHVMQANVYEAERRRFKRRATDVARGPPNCSPRNPIVRFYGWISTLVDSGAEPFERAMRRSAAPQDLARRYRTRAITGFRMLTVLSADARIVMLFGATLLGRPGLFCWIEIGPLTLVTVIGVLWHRAVERGAMTGDTVRSVIAGCGPQAGIHEG